MNLRRRAPGGQLVLAKEEVRGRVWGGESSITLGLKATKLHQGQAAGKQDSYELVEFERCFISRAFFSINYSGNLYELRSMYYIYELHILSKV